MVMNSIYKMVIIGLNRTQKFNFYLTLDRELTILECLLCQVLNKRLIKFNLICTKTWYRIVITGKETEVQRGRLIYPSFIKLENRRARI